MSIRDCVLPVLSPDWVAHQMIGGMVSGREMLLLDRYGLLTVWNVIAAACPLHIFDCVSRLMGADTEADTFQGRGKEWVLMQKKGSCTRVA